MYQSTDERYSGTMKDITSYVLRCPTPWVPWPNPGTNQVTDLANNMAGQADKLLQYNFRSGFYDSNENVTAAVIAGLILAIPSTYRRVDGGQVGTRMYQTANDPREIIT